MRERLNVRLLVILAVAGVAMAGGVFFLHREQVRRTAPELLSFADAAESTGRPDRAARLLALYLTTSPSDTTARARYGLLLEKLATSPSGRYAAVETYERVLTENPRENDVRRRLAQLYLNARQYAEALAHLDVLVAASPEDGELVLQRGVCREGLAQPDAAARDYEAAIKHSPQLIDAYLNLADLQRRTNKPAEADGTVNKMVAANEKLPTAPSRRARYKAAFKTGDPAADLRAARELAPTDADVLLASAAAAATPAEAAGFLRTALEHHAGDDRLYVALAGAEARSGRPAEGLTVLRQGVARRPGTAPLLFALADFALEMNDVAEARRAAVEAERWKLPPHRVGLLNARIMLAEGRWKEGRDRLESLRPRLATESAELGAEADLLLAACYERFGETDRELAAYRRAAGAGTGYAVARLGVARALVRAGRLDEAVREYDRLTGQANAPADVWLMNARLHTLRYLSAPAATRSREQIEPLLQETARRVPGAIEPVLLRADVYAADHDLPAARRLLEEVGAKLPNAPEVPLAVAALAAREGKVDDAWAALDGAEKRLGPSVEFDLARVRLLASKDDPHAAATFRAVDEHLDRYAVGDRVRLLVLVGESQFRWGKLAEAKVRWLAAAGLAPHDLSLRFRLFDLGVKDNNPALMEAMVREVRQAEGGEGPYSHYAEALLLIARSKREDKDDMDAARRHLVAVELARPAWANVPAARGMLALKEEKGDQALVEFLRAIDLGDLRPTVVRQAVQLLYERRRYPEADRLIRKLSAGGFLSPEVRKLAAEMSLSNADPGPALEWAVGAVSADSRDFKDQLWLAQVYAAAGKHDDAYTALRKAADFSAGDAIPWVALVRYHLHHKRKDAAEAVVREARETLAGAKGKLAVAQCLEALGRGDEAAVEYAAAVTDGSGDATVLKVATDFYQRTGNPGKIVAPLRAYLTTKPADPAWARRALALALASDPDYARFREAVAALDENLAVDPRSEADVVAKSAVLATRAGYRDAAVQLVQQFASQQQGQLSPEAQFLLARLTADRDWPNARRRLIELLGRDPDNLLALRFLADQFLAHNEVSSSEAWVGRLEQLAPDDLTTIGLRATVQVRQGQPAEAAALVRKRAAAAKTPAAVLPIARLTEELAAITPEAGPVLFPVAEEMFRFVATKSDKPADSLALAEFLARRSRAADALATAEKVYRTAPDEAIAASLVTISYAAALTDAEFGRVERVVGECLIRNPDSPTLRLVAAALSARRGRYADAERDYRLVIKQGGESGEVLNNLAYMLVLQEKPANEPERLLERVAALTGPEAEFFDTRGVVRLKAGRVADAVEDHRAAVRIGPTSLRFLHLAQANLARGDREAARQALATAGKLRGDRTLALPAEQAAFEQLGRELGGK